MKLRVFFAVIIIFTKSVRSDFVPIQWNASTDMGNSRKERLYEYPMFTDIATATCDLTENFCDSGCCLDPDCDDDQRKNFNCSKHEMKPCSRPFSRYDCTCNSESPFWFPVLCYIFENPIYLGVFYKTLAKIDNVKDFLSLTNPGKYKYRPLERVSQKKRYIYGSKVLAYASHNGSYTPYPHALLHENNMLFGLSLDCNAPVKYMKNQVSSCYVRLTKDKCEDGVSLSAKPYLLRNEFSTEMKDVPVVLKDLETEATADVLLIFKSSPLNYVTKTFKGHPYKYFYSDNTFHGFDTDLFETFWNDSVCHNIAVQAVFKFITNASEIQKVEIHLYLTNVSISNQFETVYLKKVHDVSFIDVNVASESSDDNYVFNRGYYIGEHLNVGYIRENGSHLSWQQGHLKIFLSGGSCERRRDVEFGYDTWGTCVHPIKSSDCGQVRDEIEAKLESLTRGEYLAPYGSYRDPRRSAVPLLRNYNASGWNETDCLVPMRQDVYIQYTTSITQKGFPVYEAVGAMINRTFSSLTDDDGVTLTVSVIFVDVTPSGKKPLSRFWERIYSPEGSENAWLNIFNVFDRPVTGRDIGESTFWFLLLVVVVVSATAVVLRDFH